MGKILSINVSPSKGGPKEPIRKALLLEDWGIEGDGHGGAGPRQVSLLAWESVLKMKDRGAPVGFGSFGENITTEGIELSGLKIGERLEVGRSGILEVTGIGKKCVTPCRIYRQVGYCIMPEEGIFCRVVRGGEIVKGDQIARIGAGGASG